MSAFSMYLVQLIASDIDQNEQQVITVVRWILKLIKARHGIQLHYLSNRFSTDRSVQIAVATTDSVVHMLCVHTDYREFLLSASGRRLVAVHSEEFHIQHRSATAVTA